MEDFFYGWVLPILMGAVVPAFFAWLMSRGGKRYDSMT